MSEEKIKRMVRWKSTDAAAIAHQLIERIEAAQKDGKTVGAVVCFITDVGEGRTYEVGVSTLPVEVSFWAAKEIAKHIEAIQASA